MKPPSVYANANVLPTQSWNSTSAIRPEASPTVKEAAMRTTLPTTTAATAARRARVRRASGTPRKRQARQAMEHTEEIDEHDEVTRTKKGVSCNGVTRTDVPFTTLNLPGPMRPASSLASQVSATRASCWKSTKAPMSATMTAMTRATTGALRLTAGPPRPGPPTAGS